MIQLSLFPRRGFAIILPDGSVAHETFDLRTPYVAGSRSTAYRVARALPKWMRPTRVVPVAIHEGAVPTYVIG